MPGNQCDSATVTCYVRALDRDRCILLVQRIVLLILLLRNTIPVESRLQNELGPVFSRIAIFEAASVLFSGRKESGCVWLVSIGGSW